MPIALSVNLNKIALIRNSRPRESPRIEEFGKLCLDTGAQGLTVHPRPDQRHIRPSDVFILRALVENYPNREFNIEGNPFAPAQGSYPGLMALVEQTQPHQCTLVPDSDQQLTSDHGFDLTRSSDELAPLIQQLQDQGIRVSLFMDPEVEQIKLAKQIGADRIELYTGPYAAAFEAQNQAELDQTFELYRKAAVYAANIGLGVNAGHDLSLLNLPRFATIPAIQEVSIGHALVIEALRSGMESTVKNYLAICSQSA